MQQQEYSLQSKKEEFYNTLTHAIGAVLALAGTLTLIFKLENQSLFEVISIALYCVSLVILFSASTIYHWEKDSKTKKLFRIFDHVSIYLLIAGTYSPVVVFKLLDGNGMLIFISVWSIALVGTFLKVFFTGKFEKISLLLYLLMGWLIIIDFQNLINQLNFWQTTWLALGGFFYTFGVVFYVWNKLNFNHVIWHIFVLIAAAFHFYLVYSLL